MRGQLTWGLGQSVVAGVIANCRHFTGGRANLDERGLIQAIAAGDQHAADEFIRTYLPAVLSAFRYKQIPDQDSEDLVQSFFAHISEGNYRRLRSWRGNATLKTWLITVAKNFAVDWLRRQRRLEPLDEDKYADEAGDNASADPERLQCLRERRRLISGILDAQMQGRPADLIKRRFYAEQTVIEIAADLEMTENSVRVALHRALAQLRVHLAGEPLLQGET